MTSSPQLALSYIRRSPESAARVISTLPPDYSATFIEDIPVSEAVRVFTRMQPATAARIMQKIDEEAGALILRHLDFASSCAIARHIDARIRAQFFAHLPGQLRFALENSLSYAPQTVGAHMSNTILTLSMHDSVSNALNMIRQSSDYSFDAVFVLDDQQRLVGSVSTALALRQSETEVLANIVDAACPTISAHSRLEAITEPVIWNDLASLPVVNRRREVIGVISRQVLKCQLLAQRSDFDANDKSIVASIVSALGTTSAGMLSLFADLAKPPSNVAGRSR